MELNEYQKLAMRTCKWDEPCADMLVNAGLGLAGESGEVADIIKKHVLGTKLLEKEELIKELGDVLWYIAEAANYLEIDLTDVAKANIDKLAKRHPTGFDGYGNR